MLCVAFTNLRNAVISIHVYDLLPQPPYLSLKLMVLLTLGSTNGSSWEGGRKCFIFETVYNTSQRFVCPPSPPWLICQGGGGYSMHLVSILQSLNVRLRLRLCCVFVCLCLVCCFALFSTAETMQCTVQANLSGRPLLQKDILS